MRWSVGAVCVGEEVCADQLNLKEMEVEIKSAIYIYEWAECLIILNTFQSLSQFHFSDEQRGKVEEGVHVEFGILFVLVV